MYLVHLEYFDFLPWSSSILLAGGPLQGPTVDVPPSIAVTSTLLRVAGCSRKISGLLAHREGNGARFTNRHKSQSTQNRVCVSKTTARTLHGCLPVFLMLSKMRRAACLAKKMQGRPDSGGKGLAGLGRMGGG